MEITDIIDRNLVLTQLNCRSKDDIFQTLSQVLKKENYISDTENFINDLYIREAEGQTGIGHYIAIPHSKSSSVKKVGVAIGINQWEIPWETNDGKGVRAVVLFAVGSDSEGAKEHLKRLALFARKLGRDEVVESLLAAKSPADVIAAFA
ncbi:PTS sugar transporter subunit IIA [Streptococcus sp. H49]|uniref:PTS sugar transporter subunit IIA n=1 Tax=Streptococcus huangxiaojuni TaxID=3237239 RepID=UPI0034A4D032